MSFERSIRPSIYAYTYGEPGSRIWKRRSGGRGLIKVGFTTGDVRSRVLEQMRPAVTDEPRILFDEAAISNDGSSTFSDKEVHRVLESIGASRIQYESSPGVNSEWFEATVDEIRIAYNTVRQGKSIVAPNDFAMRDEQQRAVDVTAAFFQKYKDDPSTCHFLWNCKMRFGKTFAAYQLAQTMGWRRILVLTYKPAVEDAWRDELLSHQEFQPTDAPLERWCFIGKGDSFEDSVEDERRPLVWMASFQDVRQLGDDGRVKRRLELMFAEKWDCVILDEYHFGSWREAAKAIYDADFGRNAGDLDEFEAANISVNAKHWLYLSGTPFRALEMGEFSEDQIFNWSYSDEQSAKEHWASITSGDQGNPYEELPKLVMLTYRMGEIAGRLAETSFDNEFALNEFFSATGSGRGAKFVMEDDVQRWLDWLHDSGIKLGQPRPTAPFANHEMRATLNHSVWHLPDVASCEAMRNLLQRPSNGFFHDYEVICAAGRNVGVGAKAKVPVSNAIGDGFKTKTITLTCGKLLTGVTVPQWGAIFMLRDTQSAETYFQAAFRVQSPWSVNAPDEPNKRIVVKPEAYIFDFSPIRSLDMIHGYCEKLAAASGRKLTSAASGSDVKSELRRFLNFLPVLAFDDGNLVELDENELMDIAATGIGSAMLARRWQSERMVNLSPTVVRAIMNNEDLLRALENLEAFRNLREHGARIISSDERIRAPDRKNKKKGRRLTPEEKEAKRLRDRIRKSLSQLLCKVPIFMYLTDYREETLYDVIHRVERPLFLKVTGMSISHFDALCAAGAFPTSILNQSIRQFKRQESPSLDGPNSGLKRDSV